MKYTVHELGRWKMDYTDSSFLTISLQLKNVLPPLVRIFTGVAYNLLFIADENTYTVEVTMWKIIIHSTQQPFYNYLDYLFLCLN